ncbi:MAG: F0F1 ATP synthase subunit delta [Caulobacteraceae bacterium]|nr:F0F1 ATP synthase subunit delta [Caulobacteraceae bacterium]
MADDIRETEAGARYARALYDLAAETGETAKVRSDLKALKAMMGESADLRRLVADPTFTAEDKGKGLVALAMKAGMTLTTAKFLGLLTQNRRSADLPAVIAGFERLYAAETGSVAAEVVTAVALSAKQLEGVKAQLRSSLGKDPEIETRVDPTILGGLKVKVGSRLYDASLKTRLDQLKFALKRA